MNLYAYLPVKSFVQGCKMAQIPHTFVLRVPDLLHSRPEAETGYGLSLLRRSIVDYEELEGISPERSKRDMPFFRTNRRMLIGPETYLYALSLYRSTEIPSGALSGEGPFLRLGFHYEALGEYSLSENKYLLSCKYDEGKNLHTFVSQMEEEYGKFFYDEEHTGFKRDSRLFSMLCNACLEVREPRLASEQEWRIVLFGNPAEAEYDFMDGSLVPYVEYALPFDCLDRIAFLDREKHPSAYSAFAGFLQRVGLQPERYMEGLLE